MEVHAIFNKAVVLLPHFLEIPLLKVVLDEITIVVNARRSDILTRSFESVSVDLEVLEGVIEAGDRAGDLSHASRHVHGVKYLHEIDE